MANTITSANAVPGAGGSIDKLQLTGITDCPGDLRIQISDADTGDVLALGNAPRDGNRWTKTLEAPDDISADQVACGQTLRITLSCLQDSVSTRLELDRDTVRVECPCVTIITAIGAPSITGEGLDELTITGTAAPSCTSIHVGTTAPESVSVDDVPVIDGEWTAVFRAGDPGGGTNLKEFECDSELEITATCDEDSDCTATQVLPIICSATPCLIEVSLEVRQNGQGLPSSNITCEDSAGGEYELVPTGPAGSSLTVIRWTETSSVTGDSVTLRDNDGNDIADNPLTVTINFPVDEAVNYSYTAFARDAQGCVGVATAVFSCGGIPDDDSDEPSPCVVSEWSRWSKCVNGRQTRTRIVLRPPRNGGAPCPPLEQIRICPPEIVDCEVSAWSKWGPCVDGVQKRAREVVVEPRNGGRACPELVKTRKCPVDCEVSEWSDFGPCIDGVKIRTREVVVEPKNGGKKCPKLEDPEDCGGDPSFCDPCCIWNWINIVLFFLTAGVILFTFCMLDATVVAALAAVTTGGALAPVLAALTTAEIVMLLVCAGLMIVGLISWILWLIFCCYDNPNACSMLLTLMLALSTIVALSFAAAIVFAALRSLGCFAGALIDVGWFGVILSITTLVYAALGCADRD